MNNRNTRRANWFSKQYEGEDRTNVSWGAIFAGAVTFVSVFFLLSLIGAAIGFGTLNFQSSTPFSGVFESLGIWTIVQILLSFFAGGFVSGLASRRVGFLHGFLTWSLSTALIVFTVFSLVTGLVNTTARVAGSAAQTAGKAVGGVASSAGDLVKTATDAATKEIQKSLTGVNDEKVKADIEKYLKDTENEKLKPAYLKGQVEEVTNELVETAKNIALKPENAKENIDKLAKNISERAKTISNSVSKEDIKKSVSKNSDLSQAEVEKITNNIYEGMQKSQVELEKALKDASAQLEKVSAEAEKTLNKTAKAVKDTADKATNITTAAAIWAFVGFLLGAVISIFAGKLGADLSHNPDVLNS